MDYELYAARTKFQRQGIHGVDLTEEERNALIEKGLDPDDINYEGTELERTVTNHDTICRQWEEIMEVCKKDSSGQLSGKTIIFAITQDHALRLQKFFDQMYPQFPNLTRVITHKSEYRGTLVDAFKKKDEPRIAISVDMLDTGIDVPEVVNLVFMKPVQSPIKLQQMIGRGTRVQAACRNLALLPNFEKKDFLIIDFWENNFSRDAKEVVDQSTPVLVTIFNTRLKLLETYLKDQKDPDCKQVIADLREQSANPNGLIHHPQAHARDRRSMDRCFLGLFDPEQDRIPEIESRPVLATRPWRGRCRGDLHQQSGKTEVEET